LIASEQTQSLQGRLWVVNQNHPMADDHQSGTESKPLKTIQQAAELAEPGDVVLVHTGVYRERVAPRRGGEAGRPITYKAAPGATVVIKGSEIWSPNWQTVPEHSDVYSGSLESNLFPHFNPYRTALKDPPIAGMTLGQIFVEGQPLLEVGNQQDLFALPGTWMVAPGAAALWVHFTPSSKPLEQRLVELTVRGRNFAPYKRGLGHIIVRGFIMEHCSNQLPVTFWQSDSPQAGALGCRGGHHWIIENNTIRWAKTVGIDCGSEGRQDADGFGQSQPKNAGYHLIRNNVITHNGAAGILGYRSYGTQIINNIIESNAYLGLNGSETAGIKTHFFIGGLIEGNLIRNNGASGIWLDNVWYDSRVTRNVIVNNNGAGMFIEMGFGPLLVDNNIIALNTAMRILSGDGIYSHDASGVTLVHNLIFFNANFGVWSHVATDREARVRVSFDPQEPSPARERVAASGWRIMNNLIIGNHRGAISLPARSERSHDNVSDYNLMTAAYDWVTTETYGSALAHPSFIYNTNKGRVAMSALVEQFQQALDREKVPEAKRPNLKQWADLPLLTFDQWQLLTGCDRHSVIPKVIRPDMSTSVPFLSFVVDDSPRQVGCKPIEGVDQDFLGNPMPTSQVMPGPFQQLKFEPALENRSVGTQSQGAYGDLDVEKNVNVFILWPLRNSEPASNRAGLSRIEAS
jgi:parallel beta-helix repeat protein